MDSSDSDVGRESGYSEGLSACRRLLFPTKDSLLERAIRHNKALIEDYLRWVECHDRVRAKRSGNDGGDE